MTAKRLITGGLIDRSKKLQFFWDNKKYFGYQGDTLASALLVNNIKIIGRSFKYHRPRGIMSAGVEESGALVTIGKNEYRDPNVRATTQELYDGLNAFSQNAFPNAKFDLGAINNLFNRFFAAGFYYKTFMGIPPFEWGKGTKIWMFYENFIRKAAGMGSASKKPDPDKYEHMNDYCDVIIVGSGPAGIAAALEAASNKLDVILVEQDSDLGGSYLSEDSKNLKNKISDLKNAGVRILLRTTVFGLYDSGVAGLLERVSDHKAVKSKYEPRQRFWTVRSRHTIVATGAFERHIAFGNNDLPGIMSASSVDIYLNRFSILAGKKIVVCTNNDSAYSTAIKLANSGAEVKLIDARSSVGSVLTENALNSGVFVKMNAAPFQARGYTEINKIDLAESEGNRWNNTGSEECDLLAISGGWSPTVHLLSHRGIRPKWNEENACFVADDHSEPITLAGSAAGYWNSEDCINSGKSAGIKVAHLFGKEKSSYSLPNIGGWNNPIKPVYEVRVSGKQTKSFIDFQHDVTCDDIRLAHREGFVSVEHLKRYTTLGMANDQGKMGNVIGIALMAEALGKKISEVGTTTFRPPFTPVSLGALAGRNTFQHFRALRRSPLHDWNLSHGAVMIEAGLWQRPWYFPQNNETLSDAYIRETATTRKSVGICDVTSLGKIAIQGPDSTELLNRIYTNPFAKLPIGKARYGIMLRDDGIVMDDGTSWRLSENEYFMTTSTAQAARVIAWLEELLQIRWTDLKVHVTSVSEQWCGISVAGPMSRECISKCLKSPEIISNENLPFMGVVETNLKQDIPCRIARISFSGEMAFEIYVPSDYANEMMEMIWIETEKVGGCLYGLEALGALRIEKGHVTGAELDGRVTIDDAGLGKMASTKKSYIGSAMRTRGVLSDVNREQLVGIFPKNKNATFDAGSIICKPSELKGFGVGRITSVTHSPELGHWIGLGFISGGYNLWKDKTVIATDPVRNKNVEVEIVIPHMFDPQGERMHG
ncbi:MAG: Sarcosine oxidase subunit alpha [Alphaproteobacteria bacterium MarineAlpha5_Bin11]|nr:sarcosine oxidase subunit alpha [Pelagibacteraceae bacterium]PPR44401.1 MAG: Sarcosine oxidase subunit alpha [Alphaproteobacteria bacterium MarineAlpha5_Bin11]PPR50821.1 MAG: Sarcosine oxidase subunit alpha [Alphaproteobacteria bacterium MarineAlpha5_Bin10]|tara:strand:+ start:17066 stop:20044 length:2979 start_codon:yes stop_codon:yes gene_type:complete